jgi:hypothetical protein
LSMRERKSPADSCAEASESQVKFRMAIRMSHLIMYVQIAG